MSMLIYKMCFIFILLTILQSAQLLFLWDYAGKKIFKNVALFLHSQIFWGVTHTQEEKRI